MKNKTIRFIVICILSGAAFFALTLPFHRILSVFTVSEVRPSAVLYPFLGISFGLPSALGIATANLISDVINGYPISLIIEGVFLQLLYVYAPYLVWKKLTKEEDHIHRLDSVKRTMKFVAACFTSAILSGIGVGMLVKIHYGIPPLNAGFFVFLNNFDISVILGCPLMIISNQVISRRSGTDRTVTPNEKILLAAGAAELIGLVILIVTMYTNGKTVGTYDTWNSIYLCAVVMINVILLLALIAMIRLEHRKGDARDEK